MEYEGAFKYGKRDDTWTSYYDTGKLKKETSFILERKVSQKCFDESGADMDCDDILEPIWWWKREKCFNESGQEIDCDEFYLGIF